MKKLDSIVIGLSIVAAAVVVAYGFKPAEAAFGGGKYSMKTVSPGKVWRINNETGAVSTCYTTSGRNNECGEWTK